MIGRPVFPASYNQPPNSAMDSNTVRSPLRAQRGAAKRER